MIEKFERADLEELITKGDPTREISLEEAREYARAGVEELGGCPALLELHKHDFDPDPN